MGAIDRYPSSRPSCRRVRDTADAVASGTTFVHHTQAATKSSDGMRRDLCRTPATATRTLLLWEAVRATLRGVNYEEASNHELARHISTTSRLERAQKNHKPALSIQKSETAVVFTFVPASFFDRCTCTEGLVFLRSTMITVQTKEPTKQ
ncbi:unnamed protein product, partial [Ectocarpus sp. 12 AP-2014]